MDVPWWQDCVVYQIYPRSFQDSNNDGIGDIQGIISRLGYIQSLGVDAIWLNPIFTSPMVDFGYDISDYRSIEGIFGTLSDVELLLKEAHSRNIKVIFDFSLTHTSNQHRWFQESRLSLDNDKADYYIWSDTVPNNWKGAFGGKGWSYDSQRKQYYFHSFLPSQPDLNWRNSDTVDAIFEEVKFWLEKGVDGFRLDVINSMIKDDSLRDNPRNFSKRPRPYDMQRHIFDRNRPEAHAKLRMLRKLIDEYPNRMMIGEIMVEEPGEPELAASYLGRTGDELHLTFDFSLIHTPFHAGKWQKVGKRWYEAVGRHRSPTWVLNNHDVSRSISRFKNNERKARLAAFFLCTQRGSVFIYYGEELGLPNSVVSRKAIKDPVGLRYWPFYKGRDPQRGPMVWKVGKNHGFSQNDPWLPFAKRANRYAVESQERDPDSMLTFYKEILALRSREKVLRQGICVFVEQPNQSLMVYTRIYGEDHCVVVLNFSSKKQTAQLSEFGVRSSGCVEMFSTLRNPTQPRFSFDAVVIEPYEGVLFSIPKPKSI